MVQVVLNAETTAKVNKDYGGSKAVLYKDTLTKWLQKHNPSEQGFAKGVENFLLSCAGYCVMHSHTHHSPRPHHHKWNAHMAHSLLNHCSFSRHLFHRLRRMYWALAIGTMITSWSQEMVRHCMQWLCSCVLCAHACCVRVIVVSLYMCVQLPI